MSFQAMAWAVDQKLPTMRKFVLLMLANRTNHDTGRCDPSHKRIADDCGMSIATVKRAIKELIADGYLSQESRTKNGEKQPNQYLLHLDRVGSERTHPIAHSDPTPVHPEPGVGSQGTEGVGSQGAIKQESSNQEVKQEVKQDPLQPAASAVGEVAPRVVIPADMPGPKDQACKTFKAWANYAMAYRKRYTAWPVWNAKVAGQVSQLIDRLGADVAHSVAAYYLTINDARLINECHSLNALLAKAEAFHTQWQTGRQMNGTTARQAEATQANINAAQEAARMFDEEGGRNAFL